MRGLAALLVLAIPGCVDLTTPPFVERLEASVMEVAAPAGDASGGTADGHDGAAGDAGPGDAGVDAAADAAGGIDAAAPDLTAPIADAGEAGAVTPDARADLAEPDAAPSPPDAPPDVTPSPPDTPPDVVDAAPPPPTISFTDSSSIIHAPGTGGVDFTGPCVGSLALMGLIGTSGGVVGLNSVQGTCGVIEATGGAPSYQLTTRQSATVGPYGPVRPTTHDGSCPANHVIIGFEGGSGSWINYLHVYCAPLTLTASGGSYTVTVGAPTRVATQLGMAGGTPFAARYCPAGQVATGILGAAGGAIDRFGLYCARPVAQ
jgi:hypothetical protein